MQVAKFPFVRIVVVIFLVAVALNYPWELAQAPLYEGMNDLWAAAWHCFVASLGDGLLMLLIFATGLTVLRRVDWFERPGAARYVVMLCSGLVLALTVEWVAVHVLHRWAYTNQMPRIPGIDIGIVPLAQMLVLPPIVFWVVAKICTRRGTT